MRLGIDIDGCLADFNSAFIDRIIAITGKDLFPPRPFEIPTWDYPQFYGYTREDLVVVWRSIQADTRFWAELPEYPGTAEALKYLNARRVAGDDLYFITARPGAEAKKQTENWLLQHWPMPYAPQVTVLISPRKDLCATALDLDLYVDDRDINVEAVVATRNYDGNGKYLGERTRTYVYDQPWNRDMDEAHKGATRVMTLIGIADLVAK